MVVLQKWPFFQVCFSGNIGQENVFYDILEGKNFFLSYKNRKLKKSKNWDFSKGVNQWFSSKNDYFSNFLLGNIGQENLFYDILERKRAFLGYKNSSEDGKIYTHGFGAKMAIFPTFFFFRQYRPGNSRTKNPFQG